MYEMAAIGIFRSTPDGRYIMANPAGVRMHGYDSEAELLGAVRSIADEIYVDPRDRETMRHRLEEHGSIEGFECEIYRHKTKERFWVRQNIFRVTDEDGRGYCLEGYVEDVTDFKRAQEDLKRHRDDLEHIVEERTAQLQESEQRYRTMFDTATAGIGRTQLADGKVILANKTLAQIFGYDSVDDFVSKFVFSEHYVDPEDRSRLMSTYESSPGTPIECTFTRKDGSPIDVQAHAIANFEEGILDFVAIDITERKSMEEALRKSEARFGAFIENSPSAILIKDIDGRYLIANRRWHDWFNPRASEIHGRTVFDFYPEPHAREITVSDRQVVETGIAVTVELDTPFADGTSRATLLQKFPIVDSEGVVRAIGGINTDITERKEMEDALRSREAQLNQAQRMAKLGVFVWDNVTDTAIYYSDGLAALLSMSDEQMAKWGESHESTLEQVEPEDRYHYHKVIRDSESNIAPYDVEYRIRDAEGNRRHWREMGEAIADESGRLIRTIGTIQDITDHKIAEEQLHQMQKMEAVGQLTGGVAHDFNNILAIVLGNAELLARTGEEGRKLVDAVMRAARRGAELTQRLLAFSRKQALRPRSIGLAGVVGGMSELLQRTLGETVELETFVGPGLWAATADAGQVENAILNLAINARDAMADGGKLTIECANARLDDDYVALNPEAVAGDFVAIAVSDTGTGISDAVMEHALEPFFTTKETGEGTGLGLSMIYGFAKQSGGHVKLYSEEGRGTTVKLYLPRIDEAAETADRAEAGQELRGRGQVVLVVEDDTDVRTLAVKMLAGLGYRVIDAPDARAALDVLGSGERVDLLLSDVVLPGGMSGPDLVRRVRERDPALKVVFMSGYAAEAANRNGFVGAKATLLTKPFERRELAEALRRTLEG